MSTQSDVESQCAEAGVETVRLLYVGNDGVLRGHVVEADRIGTVLREGVSLPKSVQSMTALDDRLIDGRFGSVGEVRLVPDPDTFRVVPYAPDCGVLFCDLRETNSEPWSADPRSRLSSFFESLRRDGVAATVAFESEFHLVEEGPDGLVQAGEGGVYAADRLQETHAFVRAVVDALDRQDVGFARYYPEHEPGKHEVVTDHATGTEAVEEYLLTRQTVKSLAAEHDGRATFLPAPFPGSTNGCHVHLSLWEGDENLFYDPNVEGAYPLSDRARHFVGGLLEHAPALTALAAPTVNSYARLRPQQEASAYVCWGEDNREAMVRVPSTNPGDRRGTTRIEFRPADNTANPYLCLLGLLAAGMDGVERKLSPGPPLNENPGRCADGAESGAGVERLPRTLGESIRALEDDDVLASALGPELLRSYVEVKRHLWESFTASAGEWKRDEFRRVY